MSIKYLVVILDFQIKEALRDQQNYNRDLNK